jgi:hypothetical protein
MYAFCEWLFKGDKNPKGLLNRGEVFCKVYKNSEKLDVLRSPHLYREHGIRNNVVGDKDGKKKKWFTTNGIYTSVDDLLSKLLQFDVDGDKSLVVADERFVSIAERHMDTDKIVPLYYEMASGKPEIITDQGIYDSFITAYTGSNIGEYSNSISKIWNSSSIDLEVIKWLVLENNFRIDFAKTKIMPKRPKHVKDAIHKHTKVKIPHFFIYAKDKHKSKVEKTNGSTVNKLEKIIPNPRLTFKKMGQFDYKMLMSGENKNVDLNKTIIDTYTDLDSKGYFLTSIEDKKYSSSRYVYQGIREQMLELCDDANYVVDVLVEYLYKYKKSPYKTALWVCFGDEIVNNLKKNILETYGTNTSNCEKCNVRIVPTGKNHKMCSDCWKEREKEIWRESKRKTRNV